MMRWLRSFRKTPEDAPQPCPHFDPDILGEQLKGFPSTAIFLLNSKGYIQSWSEDCERVLQRSADEVVGQHLSYMDRWVPKGTNSWRDLYQTCSVKRSGVEQTIFFQGITERRWLTAEASPYENGFIILIRDDSSRVLYRKRLEESRAHADEVTKALVAASAAKDEFLAIVSHEMRTPLTATKGWAQLLNQPNVDASTLKQGLTQIEHSIDSQIKIVEDILDMSRVLLGKFRVDPIFMDLSTVVNEVARGMAPTATARGLAYRVYTETPTHIYADPTRIKQVMWNLLSNALRYTHTGAIEIRQDKVKHGDKGYARIQVDDTGIGFEQEALLRVWDRFGKASKPCQDHGGGMGLGLSLVKHIVEISGGTAQAESAGPDKGSKFTVFLPLRDRGNL